MDNKVLWTGLKMNQVLSIVTYKACLVDLLIL